ncbi:MAG: hypothetical protein LBG46_00875 [Elusimicrobiota bacterium]|jgi:hypothetical protein|nr:hypothetical protein [Elusimicrobiota bacterium]
MKRLLAAAVLIAAFAANAAAESPVKLSLFDQIAWPQTEKANVVIGLIDNNTPAVHGVDLNLFSARTDELRGLQSAWIYNRATDMKGLQYSIVTRTDNAVGVELGVANFAGTFTGLQYGFYNKADNFTGLQLGFVNNINTIDKGLQIGLVNIIHNNGWLPFMVIVNGRF